MSSRRTLMLLENGQQGAVREKTLWFSHILKLICILSALVVAALASYALISGALFFRPAHTTWGAVMGDAENVPQDTGLPRLMKQMRNGQRGQIAAHLTANPNKVKSREVIWQEDVGIAFSNGLEFSNNSLLIQQSGLYFIYTQVVFYATRCNGRTIFLSHDMHKVSPAYPEETILLKATKSVCHHHQHSDIWYKASYQGAIFELDEGDRIFSRVSKTVVRYLDTKEGKTFFGAFAL